MKILYGTAVEVEEQFKALGDIKKEMFFAYSCQLNQDEETALLEKLKQYYVGLVRSLQDPEVRPPTAFMHLDSEPSSYPDAWKDPLCHLGINPIKHIFNKGSIVFGMYFIHNNVIEHIYTFEDGVGNPRYNENFNDIIS